MAAARLAPVLSATSRMERICNMNYLVRDAWSNCDWSDAGAAPHDLDQAPALGLGQRAGLLDAHAVADFGFVLFIVGVKLLIAGHDFLELRMRKPPLDPHDDGFGHLVGDDFTQALLAFAAGSGQVLHISGGLNHRSKMHWPPIHAHAGCLRSCERRVSMRATSRRNVRPSASSSARVFSWISFRFDFFIRQTQLKGLRTQPIR